MRIYKLIPIKHSEQWWVPKTFIINYHYYRYLRNFRILLCFTKWKTFMVMTELAMMNLFRKKIFLINSKYRDKFNFMWVWLRRVGPSPNQLVGICTRESSGVHTCGYSPRFIPSTGFRNDGHYLYPLSLKGRKWGDMAWPCVIESIPERGFLHSHELWVQPLRRNKPWTQVH